MTTHISLVIPVKNEPYLPKLLDKIEQNLRFSCYDVHIQTEAGLANAVLCGVRSSVGDVVCVLDADGSHSPRYIPAMVKALKDYDVVIGSRYVKGGRTADYFLRMIISRLFCKFSRTVFNLSVADTMSGFIVAKRGVYEKFALNPIGYKFGLELMVKGRSCLKVAEFPVAFERRKMGFSKTGLGQGVKTVIFILRLKIEELVRRN